MPRDARVFLWDARDAAEQAVRFTAGLTLADYRSDELVRAAVERQLSIVGEALARLRDLDPALANRVPDLHAVVGLRNVLIHGYFALDQRTVWNAATVDAPRLVEELTTLLEELDAQP